MGAAYEDNFGFWDLDQPEERAFFHHVRRESVRAVCKRCERIVRLMPPTIFCALARRRSNAVSISELQPSHT
jgi:hypothetical protein